MRGGGIGAGRQVGRDAGGERFPQLDPPLVVAVSLFMQNQMICIHNLLENRARV